MPGSGRGEGGAGAQDKANGQMGVASVNDDCEQQARCEEQLRTADVEGECEGQARGEGEKGQPDARGRVRSTTGRWERQV